MELKSILACYETQLDILMFFHVFHIASNSLIHSISDGVSTQSFLINLGNLASGFCNCHLTCCIHGTACVKLPFIRRFDTSRCTKSDPGRQQAWYV